MTLILTCATRHFVVQAADSYLTLPNGELVEPDAVKSVFFCGRTLFGFTGLAKIGEDRATWANTADWLTETIVSHSEAPIEEALAHVAECATRDVARTDAPNKTLAIVGAGLRAIPGTRVELESFLCSVANFDNRTVKWTDNPEPEFTHWIQPAPQSSVPNEEWLALRSDGVSVARGRRDQLINAVLEAASARQGPIPVMEHFVDLIREVGVTNKRVGGGVIATVLPALAAATSIVRGGGELSINNLADPAAASSLYFPPDQHDGVAHSPNYACGFAHFGVRMGGPDSALAREMEELVKRSPPPPSDD